ncbi:MAG: DUF3501 family protein, partial [Acidimicrobiales bacterium]
AKRLRRISVGPFVTLTFENRLTMRFQVQEMARAEKMTSDEQIEHELEVYNQLLPAEGELSATLFLELTDEQQLRTWLPRLVGIERSAELHLGAGPTEVISSIAEAGHQSSLTRETETSAVHYVRFRLTEDQIDAFSAGPVRLAVSHPEYLEGLPGVELGDACRTELLSDLRPG